MYSGDHTSSSAAAATTAEAAAAMPSYFMASFYPMELSGSGVSDPATDRALLASRNHREAEKRRRERIKYHLERLRTLLALDPKTDKASLLAKAVERVRDLRQRAAEISETQFFPTETDEIVVLPSNECYHSPSSGCPISVYKATLCCEDRSDLLPELIETLRTLRLKTIRAEIATLGGRMRNVLVVTGDHDAYEDRQQEESCSFSEDVLRDALKELVDRRSISTERTKRRRVVNDRVTV